MIRFECVLHHASVRFMRPLVEEESIELGVSCDLILDVISLLIHISSHRVEESKEFLTSQIAQHSTACTGLIMLTVMRIQANKTL